ncbi:acyl carrier protein [Allorhizobium terrae]|uniref:Acyl carrier protein n=1 Tax=Allorhizobium terrae TaxID=1848972 RepID=A0A4S3ZU36_9HYPH|nr:acyl carrier protein [Allorhizobium terrae]THF49228.1 acyl carrier protein [Allorhizobium terrae]TWD44821.1 acyl carrier protein [Agrobacterium vitis]
MAYEAVVVGVIAELLDLDEDQLGPDTVLAGVEGWDSVNALRVLVFLERETAQPVDYQLFMAAEKVADIVKAIKTPAVT